MLSDAQRKTQAIIDQLDDQIVTSLPATLSAPLGRWIRQLLATVALEDLEEHTTADLCGATLSFWHFMHQRAPNEIKIRAYNPEIKQHGWVSEHSIIEIVCEDMPFLVDSVIMALNKAQITSNLIIHSGAIAVVRDPQHQVVDVLAAHQNHQASNVMLEGPILIKIAKQDEPAVLADLEAMLHKIIVELRLSVRDWLPMRAVIQQTFSHLEQVADQIDDPNIHEAIAFIKWIENHNFTLIGIRDYQIEQQQDNVLIEPVLASGLGVFREGHHSKLLSSTSLDTKSSELTLSKQVLFISKTNTLSTIHRPAYTDHIRVKLFNDQGQIVGERRIIGLFTSAAYHTNPSDIPLLRGKVEQVLTKSELASTSHAGKILKNILDTLPRDELFQASADELLELSLGIFHLQERRKIKLFIRKDPYNKFVSCFLYVPRDLFNTALRQKIQTILCQAFSAHEVQFSTYFSESVLTRIHFVIRLPRDKVTPDYQVRAIEQQIITVARSWQDDLCVSLSHHFGHALNKDIIQKYKHAFTAGYRETYDPRAAVHDIVYLEQLSEDHASAFNVYKTNTGADNSIRFKTFRLNEQIPLSDAVPILEQMGLRVISEQPYEIKMAHGQQAWINDFEMIHSLDNFYDVNLVKDIFQTCFKQVWLGQAENDGLNALILAAKLDWREIMVLRSYAKFLQQIGFRYSQNYIEKALLSHPEISKHLIALFHHRFDPKLQDRDPEHLEDLCQQLEALINQVQSLDEDSILRRYFDLIKATVRTNYYQVDDGGQTKSYLSLKFASKEIPHMPQPVPMFEIFVYSPRFEAVHLRSSKVARGGLRWSDRPEDFRLEVLGLMKAQVVKNSVIVPSGAKGGFYPKCLSGGRDQIQQEVIRCYQDFIRGLLDITDNKLAGAIVPPQQVVRHDDDDPYLVVAADKGTATFSDIANQLSKEYNFWLGDAFASGGSVGYDHKKMGITARGAWESVKRHFRELGKNIQKEAFTVVGIGDMAGDVFGNGMLLSPHIQLVAAFNHMHIFIDPDPDPASTYQERARLFKLPRSSWQDFNADLLSTGGGVFARSDKSIEISQEMQRALAITEQRLTPDQLIKAILKAPVDLLWNGGIGTFVKSVVQTHQQAGDKANDDIRIDSNQLRCKVIGEGGNLGLTQLARMEYALDGGLIYSDFIDNSAGVDCSDHEVNIKILLNEVLADGNITTQEREDLLSAMTEEVGQLVIFNNYRHTSAVSLAAEMAAKHVDLHSRYIDHLEKTGKLDRALEFIPDSKVLMERKLDGKGMTRPGISVLLSYSKIELKNFILHSDIPEDQFFLSALEQEFPKPLKDTYHDYIKNHSLRREIIATQLSNDVVNEMGFTFAHRLHDETGAPMDAIVRSYALNQKIFEIPKLRQQIDALDNQVPSQLQQHCLILIIRMLRRCTRWFLRHYRQQFDMDAAVSFYRDPLQQIIAQLPDYLIGQDKAYFESSYATLKEAGLAEPLCRQLSCMRALQGVLPLIYISQHHHLNLEKFMKIYYRLGDVLDLSWMRSKVISYDIANYWEGLARESLRDDLDWQQQQLALGIYHHSVQMSDLSHHLTQWSQCHSTLIDRWHHMLSDIRSAGQVNFTMFFVAIRELLDLTQTTLQHSRVTKNG